MDRVAGGRFAQRQLLGLPLPRPPAGRGPVRPGHQHGAGAQRRSTVRREGLDVRAVADGERAQPGADLGDRRVHVVGDDLELLAGQRKGHGRQPISWCCRSPRARCGGAFTYRGRRGLLATTARPDHQRRRHRLAGAVDAGPRAPGTPGSTSWWPRRTSTPAGSARRCSSVREDGATRLYPRELDALPGVPAFAVEGHPAFIVHAAGRGLAGPGAGRGAVRDQPRLQRRAGGAALGDGRGGAHRVAARLARAGGVAGHRLAAARSTRTGTRCCTCCPRCWTCCWPGRRASCSR